MQASAFFQRRLAAGMFAFLLGALLSTPAATNAAVLYTDFDAWQADAGAITNTLQFDWYEYGPLPVAGFTLAGGTALGFTPSVSTLSLGDFPHDGFGNPLWGGSEDAHTFRRVLGSPSGRPNPPLIMHLTNNAAAGGFWVTVQLGDTMRFTFEGIDMPLDVAPATTQFIGWVGQDMTAITIAALGNLGIFYIGDFFEGTGPTPVPEPMPLLLLALGWLALLAARKQYRRNLD